MDSWHRGFSSQDVELVHTGATQYNTFVVWMQSKSDSDFKRMR